jgi:hypothetical protein
MTTINEEASPLWRKSRYSYANGACVEVARSGKRRVLVRDSKKPGDGHLAFTKAEWRAFVAGVKDGDFDDTLR